jgi:hypothetical protein
MLPRTYLSKRPVQLFARRPRRVPCSKSFYDSEAAIEVPEQPGSSLDSSSGPSDSTSTYDTPSTAPASAALTGSPCYHKSRSIRLRLFLNKRWGAFGGDVGLAKKMRWKAQYGSKSHFGHLLIQAGFLQLPWFIQCHSTLSGFAAIC